MWINSIKLCLSSCRILHIHDRHRYCSAIQWYLRELIIKAIQEQLTKFTANCFRGVLSGFIARLRRRIEILISWTWWVLSGTFRSESEINRESFIWNAYRSSLSTSCTLVHICEWNGGKLLRSYGASQGTYICLRASTKPIDSGSRKRCTLKW